MPAKRPSARRPALTATSVLLVACLAACRGDEAVMVEPATGAPIGIDAVPRLTVGVVEGDSLEVFDRVVTPFLLPGGRLVVPLAGVGTLRVFGPDGAFIESLGRGGEGPGEFSSLSSAWVRGDTIEAFDSELGRITRFLPDGGVDVVTLSLVQGAQSALPEPLPGGWALSGVESVSPEGRDQMVVHLFGRDGEHLGEVARGVGMRRYRTQRFGGPEPLSPRAVMGIHAGAVFVAETLTPQIRVIDPGGALLREIRWDPPPSPSPGEVLQEVVDVAVAQAAPASGDAVRAMLLAAPMSDGLSAFWGFLVDDEGFVWIRGYEPLVHAAALGGLQGVGGGGEWTILTPEGEFSGTVRVPEDLEPVRITSDAVVGIARDDFGVESVRIHALHRR